MDEDRAMGMGTYGEGGQVLGDGGLGLQPSPPKDKKVRRAIECAIWGARA